MKRLTFPYEEKLSRYTARIRYRSTAKKDDLVERLAMYENLGYAPEDLLRKADPVADPEEGAATEQQAEEPEQKEEKPEQQAEIPEQKEKKTSAPKKKVEHGRIVALYTANPPRSIRWIADDCKCSEQTVINHLKQEGIYKTLQERREENQEEDE